MFEFFNGQLPAVGAALQLPYAGDDKHLSLTPNSNSLFL